MSFLGRLAPRGARPPSERGWKRSAVLEPRLVGPEPERVSDGSGLSFSPAALVEPAVELDREDQAVRALIVQLSKRSGERRASGGRSNPHALPSASLEGWRLLARDEDEALFGCGQPPQLVTVAVKKEGRRPTWKSVAVSNSRPLRAARDRIRASSWRLDPTHELAPDDTVLRVLVTEQTFSGGQRATGRVLAPDLHLGTDELVLTMFVTPKPGFQVRAPNPETPVRVALPEAVGLRELIDGALYEPAGDLQA